MRYWIQSFLLGVPKIIVGFRTQGGILSGVEEFSTLSMPQDVQRRKTAKWDGNVCIKFTSLFLECKILSCPFSIAAEADQHVQGSASASTTRASGG